MSQNCSHRCDYNYYDFNWKCGWKLSIYSHPILIASIKLSHFFNYNDFFCNYHNILCHTSKKNIDVHAFYKLLICFNWNIISLVYLFIHGFSLLLSMGLGYIIIYMPILSTYVDILNPHIISMDKKFTWAIKFKSYGCSNVFQMWPPSCTWP
jgi:hypothetical protein